MATTRRRFPWQRRRATRVDEADTVVRGGPPPPPSPDPIPEREIWPWLLALLIVVLGAIAGYVIYQKTRDDDKTTQTRRTVTVASSGTVPSVVGLQQTEAVAKLNRAGLKSRLKPQSSSRAVGVVFGQDKRAGTKLPKGSVVELLVSSGGAQVSVPNVVGLSAAAAASALKDAGLTSKATSVASPKPSGAVVSQDPAAGAKAAKGSAVALSVSKGAAKTAVPDVVGKTSAEAQAQLKDAGFTYTIVLVPSAQARGIVVSQSPAGGTQAAQGAKVRLNVAQGGGTTTRTTTTTTTTTGTTTAQPATASVPNVVGLVQTVAQRRLQRAGLGSNVVYVASSRPAGRVVAQSPAAGTSLKRGSRVRINVSTGPNPKPLKTVPDVTGQDEQTATTTLQDAGFAVQVFDEPTTDQSEDGVVLDEQPAGGTRAPQGAQVAIFVGRFGG